MSPEAGPPIRRGFSPFPGVLSAAAGVTLGFASVTTGSGFGMGLVGAFFMGLPLGYFCRRWITEVLSFPPAGILGCLLGLSRATALDPTSHNLAPFEILRFLTTPAPLFAFSVWLGTRLRGRDGLRGVGTSLWERGSAWIVPVSLTTAIFVWVTAGALLIELQIRRADPLQLRSTALKLRAAQIHYFRQHGAFAQDGRDLRVDGITWAPPVSGVPEWSTVAGGYTIKLQSITTCTPGTCLLIAHPPGGGRICVTVDGQIKPDSDLTLREEITTGDAVVSPGPCIPPDRE